VYGRFGYSDLKEAALPGYGFFYGIEPILRTIRNRVARSAVPLLVR
jgi:hypothetical protein